MGMFGHERWHIARVEQSLTEDAAQTNPEFSTGDPEDDQILRIIASKSDLHQPREWMHFLPCASEAAALAVGQGAADFGFSVKITTNRRDRDWCVVAEQSEVILTAALVRRAREFFQALADQVPGASYDGWHASI